MREQKVLEAIGAYHDAIKAASKEFRKKEVFKDLINRLYSDSPEVLKVINAMTAGSEYEIVSIPRNSRLNRGSADTLYNNIIIEFENSIASTAKENHAKRQLAGYLLGQWKSHQKYDYTLIASDFERWHVYYVDYEQIASIDSLEEETLKLIKDEDRSFVLTSNNYLQFYSWIDSVLLKEGLIKATLKEVESNFGYKSGFFRKIFSQFNAAYLHAKKFGEVQVSFEQWKKFMSVAYGKRIENESIFLIHTYLSVFSKLLAFQLLDKKAQLDDSTLISVIDGSAFQRLFIKNFVEDDFFHWVVQRHIVEKFLPMFRDIYLELSQFDFSKVDEDILKGIYQELIDLDTRHGLGEYYTPDWLCTYLLKDFNIDKGDKCLDPSCGSGSFLRAIIERILEIDPSRSPEAILNQVYGIDIHPLSVQIAKTTVLLALGEKRNEITQPLLMNIIMANSLVSEDDDLRLFDDRVEVKVDKQSAKVARSIFDDESRFGESISFLSEYAELTINKSYPTIAEFEGIYRKAIASNNSSVDIASFFQIGKLLHKAKSDRRDSIWKFVLSNSYKPLFLKGKFQYVIGNPPWFTFSSIKNEDYQNQLEALAERYQVIPAKKVNMPHLEIASIFLAYCAEYFLKPLNGNPTLPRIAFVLPRSFLNANQHDKIRSGVAKGFKITEIIDLEGVSPMFNIPSCVIVGQKANQIRKVSSGKISGRDLSGRLTKHNSSYAVAIKKLQVDNVVFSLSQLGANTAFVKGNVNEEKDLLNPYKLGFKQGATLVPRTFVFVDRTSTSMSFESMAAHYYQTANSIKSDAKAPWKDVDLQGLIENKHIFYTFLSKSVFPYAIVNPSTVFLPIKITQSEGQIGELNQEIELLDMDGIILNGCINAAKWYRNCDNIWNIHRTEKSKSMTFGSRLNFQRGITDQNLNKRYLVLYNASAKDANAGVVDRLSYSLPVIVESVCYAFYTDEELEAYYVAAYLNSKHANIVIKDFQAKGLFGPRHVHKKILDVYFPLFDMSNENHMSIAFLAKELSAQVADFITDLAATDGYPDTALKLGKWRTWIKAKFAKQIDNLETLLWP